MAGCGCGKSSQGSRVRPKSKPRVSKTRPHKPVTKPVTKPKKSNGSSEVAKKIAEIKDRLRKKKLNKE